MCDGAAPSVLSLPSRLASSAASLALRRAVGEVKANATADLSESNMPFGSAATAGSAATSLADLATTLSTLTGAIPRTARDAGYMPVVRGRVMSARSPSAPPRRGAGCCEADELPSDSL